MPWQTASAQTAGIGLFRSRKNGDVGSLRVGDYKVRSSIAIHIGDGDIARILSTGKWRSGRGREVSFAVTEQHTDRCIHGVRDDNVRLAIVVYVCNRDVTGPVADTNCSFGKGKIDRTRWG